MTVRRLDMVEDSCALTPKSASFAAPSRVRRMLPALRSRSAGKGGAGGCGATQAASGALQHARMSLASWRYWRPRSTDAMTSEISCSSSVMSQMLMRSAGPRRGEADARPPNPLAQPPPHAPETEPAEQNSMTIHRSPSFSYEPKYETTYGDLGIRKRLRRTWPGVAQSHKTYLHFRRIAISF